MYNRDDSYTFGLLFSLSLLTFILSLQFFIFPLKKQYLIREGKYQEPYSNIKYHKCLNKIISLSQKIGGKQRYNRTRYHFQDYPSFLFCIHENINANIYLTVSVLPVNRGLRLNNSTYPLKLFRYSKLIN